MKRRAVELALRACASLVAVFVAVASSPAAGATALQANDDQTVTPIKHVIVIIGENRTFDHVFATYRPRAGQSVVNLLSEGIVNSDGSPGPNFAEARQFEAAQHGKYEIAPADKTPYQTLPPAMTDSAPETASDAKGPPFATLAVAADLDGGILASDLPKLLTGATGLPAKSIDTRVANATSLPNGPWPITPGVPRDAYAGGPIHRFFQMWQQVDCAASHATARNPSGCLSDLFPWVEVSAGDSNGKPPPSPLTNQSTGEGSAAMSFYNMDRGDAPYLKTLADDYAISDNFHQAVMGGTGANHIMLGTGDMLYYSDGKGSAAPPPMGEIENPEPQSGTNNWYTQDGYGGTGTNGGSYVACADATQPGVAAIRGYLQALPSHPQPNCESGRYYLVNNYNPGYLGNGTLDTGTFTIPPSSVPTIGDALLRKKVSFRYYGEGWNAYRQDPSNQLYCNICNFLQYTSSIMTSPALVIEHIRDLPDFYNDLIDDALPAVSFIKPSGLNDGHPASSTLDLFEAFVRKVVTEVKRNPAVWRSTAIFVTFDEGGGYWDSGYIQPLDFFGDGPRIPLIVISPFAEGGKVNHAYADHVSLIKFIEHNWGVPPISARSRDNLPNPTATTDSPYVPTNGPAISDLSDIFSFP